MEECYWILLWTSYVFLKDILTLLFQLIGDLYRSPSQNKDDFETFSENLESNFDHMAKKNPFMMVVLGDFNAKSKS